MDKMRTDDFQCEGRAVGKIRRTARRGAFKRYLWTSLILIAAMAWSNSSHASILVRVGCWSRWAPNVVHATDRSLTFGSQEFYKKLAGVLTNKFIKPDDPKCDIFWFDRLWGSPKVIKWHDRQVVKVAIDVSDLKQHYKDQYQNKARIVTEMISLIEKSLERLEELTGLKFEVALDAGDDADMLFISNNKPKSGLYPPAEPLKQNRIETRNRTANHRYSFHVTAFDLNYNKFHSIEQAWLSFNFSDVEGFSEIRKDAGMMVGSFIDFEITWPGSGVCLRKHETNQSGVQLEREDVIRLLYDPRLLPGMGETEVEALLPEVVNDHFALCRTGESTGDNTK